MLVGSSTGCQDIVALLRASVHKASVTAVVLQAPVSDREYLVQAQPTILTSLALAERLIAEGKGEELMPRATLDVPITAHRLRAIVARGGEDGMVRSSLHCRSAICAACAAAPCSLLDLLLLATRIA